jgi:hypothetical protein
MDNQTIGTAAGYVWSFLKENGDTSLASLEKNLKHPKSELYMGIGWLAREGKLTIMNDKRTTKLHLND